MDLAKNFCAGTKANVVVGKHDIFTPPRLSKTYLNHARHRRVTIRPPGSFYRDNRRATGWRRDFQAIFSNRTPSRIDVFYFVRGSHSIRITSCPKSSDLLGRPSLHLVRQVPAIKLDAGLRDLKPLLPRVHLERVLCL